MNNEKQISETIESIVKSIEGVNEKHYWMIRTDNGVNYNDFVKNNYVSLNVKNYPLALLFDIEKQYIDVKTRSHYIRESLILENKSGVIDSKYKDTDPQYVANFSRLANQICTLAYEVKKDDIVIIPNRGANLLSIGQVVDDGLYRGGNIQNAFSFIRCVRWLKEIEKSRLDPCLYKALGAHQAVCDITDYSEYVERNINSYFIIDKSYNYVLTVNANDVSALELTSMIQNILMSVNEFSKIYDLGIDVGDVKLSINVNSPGKFGFSTTAQKIVVIMAMVVALAGGTLVYGDLEVRTNGLFRELVKSINEWKDSEQQRQQNEELFKAYINSLDIKSVEDWNKRVDDVMTDTVSIVEPENDSLK